MSLFQNPTTFLGFQVGGFSPLLVAKVQSPDQWEKWSYQAPRDGLIWRRDFSSQPVGWRPCMHNGNGKVQEPVRGAPHVTLVRTPVQILGLPLSGRKVSPPPGLTQVSLSRSKTLTSRHWKWGGNLGCLHVKVCEWDIAWLQSKCGVMIHRSVANSYGLGWVLTGPLVQLQLRDA
jgi:hypothetical protein